MKYKDLFIDFDDTLYDTRGNAIISLRELFEWGEWNRWFQDPNVFYDAYWEANISLWGQYAHGEVTREYLIVERFRRPLLKGNVAPETITEEYCLKVSDKFLELCSCKPGVVDGAHELVSYLKKQGYRLHICSNGFHEVQYKKLEASNLLEYFDTIVLSEDAGANKPSRQFFDYALTQSGADRQTTLMIGDNYNTDILGAMDSGIDTMLFQRWDRSFVPPTPPTFIVDTLPEIKNVL